MRLNKINIKIAFSSKEIIDFFEKESIDVERTLQTRFIKGNHGCPEIMVTDEIITVKNPYSGAKEDMETVFERYIQSRIRIVLLGSDNRMDLYSSFKNENNHGL